MVPTRAPTVAPVLQRSHSLPSEPLLVSGDTYPSCGRPTGGGIKDMAVFPPPTRSDTAPVAGDPRRPTQTAQ